MIKIKLNINIGIKSIININRYQKQNQPILLSVAAARFEQFLRNRFIRNARGGGEWPPLAPSTIERKEQRGIAENPEWILRESDLILESIGTKVTGGVTHVGFVRDKQHHRGIRLLRLARIHSVGNSKLPARRVVDGPNTSTLKRMSADTRDQYNKLIRRMRKNG